MILDERNEFADATVLPTATGRSLVGDVIDLGVARDIGQYGVPLYFVVQIAAAVVGTTSTVSFELVSDAQAAIATNGTATVHYATAAIPEATLVLGYQVAKVPLPLENPAYERYLGVISNVAVNVLSAGAINAFLTLHPAAWKSHPDAAN